MEISNFIDNEYKRFSLYTLYHRAIPSLIDGLKDSQRKALFSMMNNNDKVKVLALSGKMISNGYVHGDGPACQTISKMAQNYIGSNNIPYFFKKGNFGNRFIQTPSAPRYIYVKNNPFFKKIFLDKMLEKKNLDLENSEPRYFLPIIPTILINGINGIAVGFATEILPYNLETIKKYIINYIDKKPLPTLIPYYKDYTGEIKFVDDKWTMFGKYKILNTTSIKISEIPVQYDREKYLIQLKKLIDNGLINSFIDKSAKNWDITIQLKRKSLVFKDPIKYLKLKQILSENITTIDEHENLKLFLNVYDLIDYFINFRLNIYQKRKDWMIQNISDNIQLNINKIRFINYMTKINFKKMLYSDIVDSVIENLNLHIEIIKKCMEINVYNLNIDYINKLNQKNIDLQKELKYYKNVTIIDLYKEDLKKI